MKTLTKKNKNFIEFKTEQDWNDKYYEIYRIGSKDGKRFILEQISEAFKLTYPEISSILKVLKDNI